MGTEKKVKKVVRKKVVKKTIKRLKEDNDPKKEEVAEKVTQETLPKSILAIGVGDQYSISDSDSDSSSDDAMDRRKLVNRDMLGSFIEQKSDNFIEPELATSTGVMSTMQTALDSRVQKEILTTKQPSPFLAFSNTITAPQVKVPLSLPMEQQFPQWLEANSPLKVQKGITLNPVSALHLELKEFCSFMRMSRTHKKSLMSAGKEALQYLQEQFPELKGTLVGSLATRLFHKKSTVDVAVWGDVTLEQVKEVMAKQDRYTFLNENNGVVPTLTYSTPSDQIVKIIIGDHASSSADFIAQLQGLYQERLFMLVVTTTTLIGQRHIKGGLTTHVITLMAISYLNQRVWSEDHHTNLAVLFVDFLRFLTYRFNSFVCCLNPIDPTGVLVGKASLSKVIPAPSHFLHVIDPVTGHNAASNCFNWAVCREVLEHSVQMLSLPWPPASLVDHHAFHPQAILRPTLLSRVIISSKV